MTNILVAGAGGFIGGHLVKRLINEGNKITTGGLKYNLKDEVLKSRSHGISNSTIEDNFFIECVKPILLFRKL